jgi:hypothetical protein
VVVVAAAAAMMMMMVTMTRYWGDFSGWYLML